MKMLSLCTVVDVLTDAGFLDLAHAVETSRTVGEASAALAPDMADVSRLWVGNREALVALQDFVSANVVTPAPAPVLATV